MSLINDALKRAKQAQQKTAPPPVAGAPLRPIETPSARGAGSRTLLPLAIGLLLLLVGVVLIWVAVARGGKRPAPVIADGKPGPHSAAVQSAASAVNPAPPAPSVERQPLPANTPQSAPEPVPNASATPQSIVVANPPVTAPAPDAAPATNVPPVVAEAPPALPKLQGIFYRPDRPSALLNGKTILVGGRSGEFLVVAITQQSVTLVRAGVTNVLSLPE